MCSNRDHDIYDSTGRQQKLVLRTNGAHSLPRERRRRRLDQRVCRPIASRRGPPWPRPSHAELAVPWIYCTFLTFQDLIAEDRGNKTGWNYDDFTPHDSFQGSMLGRGVKRKWSCLEEPEAERVIATVAEEAENEAEEKKKEEEEGGFLLCPDTPDMSHVQQRQLVLGLCLEKLQRCQAGVELSLRRSVLLINTLRQIQEEMRSDGSDSQFNAPLDGVDPDSRLLRCEMPVTCPGCAEGERDSPPLSSVFPSPEATNGSTGQLKTPPAATHSSFSDAVNTMGYLSDLALDDIFEDIDTSMYETSDLPAAWAAGSFWPVSVSLWAEEEVKVRSASPASAGTLQSCLMDLNELDHIMEILVKS